MTDKGETQDQSEVQQQPTGRSDHTSDSAAVQGQDSATESSKAPAGKARASDPREGSARPAPFDVRTYQPKSKMTNDMLAFDKSLNSLLSWKEELKLLTLDVNINHSYYGAWVEEANRIFIRCVSLRKRLKRYANKGG